MDFQKLLRLVSQAFLKLSIHPSYINLTFAYLYVCMYMYFNFHILLHTALCELNSYSNLICKLSVSKILFQYLSSRPTEVVFLYAVRNVTFGQSNYLQGCFMLTE